MFFVLRLWYNKYEYDAETAGILVAVVGLVGSYQSWDRDFVVRWLRSFYWLRPA
jgi:hypothetical protein